MQEASVRFLSWEDSLGEGTGNPLQYSWASLVAQLVKNLPAMRGDLGSIPGLGRSPGEEKGYPLQYSSLENSMVSPWGHKELDMTKYTHELISQNIKIKFHMWIWGFPGSAVSKESACNAGTWVHSLGLEDPLEKGTATHSSILAWRIP